MPVSSTIKDQRGSVVSSISIQVAPTSSSQAHIPVSSQSSGGRLGRPQSFAQRLRSSTKIGRGKKMNFYKIY